MKLRTLDMARFVADGYLRFDGVVPEDINAAALAELPTMPLPAGFEPSALTPASGTPLRECYPPESGIARMLAVPEVAGAIESLVGPDPVFDHSAVHHNPAGSTGVQGLHADAVIDTADPTFDIQVFYFPHAVEADAGGTRFVPGSHLRRVHENSVSRYQHIDGEQRFIGPAGSVLIFHHGLWHAGQANPSADDRWMFKVRLNPTAPQVRRWDTSDYDTVCPPSNDHLFATMELADTVANRLRSLHPWCHSGEYRLEVIQRVHLWRYLSGDHSFDVDWYLTRLDRPGGET